MKLRLRAVNYNEQYLMDDPYGTDLGGEGYIESFLSTHFDLDDAYRHLAIGRAKLAKRRQAGYEFVEAIDPKDGRRYRYTGFVEQPGIRSPKYSQNYYRVVLVSALSTGAKPRYGVTFDDISTRQDRDYWIAGSSLKVIDLQENRVIAERIGYMYDPGQGNTGRGRSPWLLAAAHACPAFSGTQPHVHRLGQTAKFVEKVLVPCRARPCPAVARSVPAILDGDFVKRKDANGNYVFNANDNYALGGSEAGAQNRIRGTGEDDLIRGSGGNDLPPSWHKTIKRHRRAVFAP